MTDPQLIQAALSYIPAYDRDVWCKIGMAVKSELGEEGFPLWSDWSATADTYRQSDARAVWKSFKPSGPVTIASLFGLAKEHGYRPEHPARPIDPAEMIRRAQARQEAERIERENTEASHREAARKAADLWSKANPHPDPNHAYLARKGVPAVGVRQMDDALIVPIYGEDKALVGLQFIRPDGQKRFITGTRKAGSWCVLKQEGIPPADWDAILIAEGWATAASLHTATGKPVFIAFDCGNLSAVARYIRREFPSARLLFCADDDAHGKGLHHAQQAARQTNGMAIIPQWGGIDMSHERLTDFNDLHRAAGLDAVRHQIGNALENFTTEPAGPANDAPEPEEWPEPLPIPDSLPPVEAFSYDLLPQSIRAWVHDIAERMQCPPDFPAVGAMVALSSVIGRKAAIRPKRYDDWTVIPNLWGVIVGRPGVMKSPALSEIMKPLSRLEVEAGNSHADALREYTTGQKLAAMDEKAAEKKAAALVAKGKHDEAKRLLLESGEEEAMPPPPMRRYKVTDSTMEALGDILIDNPQGVLVYRDEISGLLQSLDRDGQEGARAFYLQGYDGNQGYTFDRIMRGKFRHVEAVCLSLLGGTQPGKIQAYIRDAMSGGAGDDGLLQRFGLLVWPDISGEWRNVDRWPDTPARQQAFAVFQHLDALPFAIDADTGKAVPHEFRFSDDAQPLFDAWRSDLEHSLRAGGAHPAIESHISKYRKLVPALALVCALADGEPEVSRMTLIRALSWCDYLRTHAERAYASGSRPATQGAAALLAKIEAGKVADGFKPADVYLKGWSGLATPENVQAAAAMLCDLNHLQRIQHKTGPAGGRPSVTYRIHPAYQRGSKS